MAGDDIVLAAVEDLRDPPDPRFPGATAWTGRICRHLNGLPETLPAVAYCGLCRDYANPRKRARSARLGRVLPGLESLGGAFQIHPPCEAMPFNRLMKILRRLTARGLVTKERVQIPDGRQPRGWDLASNYRTAKEE